MTPPPADDAKPALPQPRRRSRKAPQYPDRRSEIIAASARLFAEYGFESTSVRQIADAVNILAGSLYHHFETKEEILHEIIRGPSVEIAEEIERIAQLPIDAEQKLIVTVLVRFHQYIRHWEVHAIMQHDTPFFRHREDFLYVQAIKTRNFDLLEATLEDGMAQGLFRKDFDPYLMIGMITRIVSSAANWFRTGDPYGSNMPESYPLDVVIDFHLDGILRLVRPPARLEAPVLMEQCAELARSCELSPGP